MRSPGPAKGQRVWTSAPYTPSFFSKQAEATRRSAEVIVPIVMEMVRPKSVVDVGCALGTWLSCFQQCGVEEILGIDGNYLDKGNLEIPQERFVALDLRNPLRLNRRFDLAVSLEVAENLPEQCAESFVNSLVRLAPVILFSAAVPFQGGPLHINERWPEYWVKYFRDQGYVAIDVLRRKIWTDTAVLPYYAQNILFFVDPNRMQDFPAFHGQPHDVLSLVHPRIYESQAIALSLATGTRPLSLREVLAVLPGLVAKALGRRIRKLLRHPCLPC